MTIAVAAAYVAFVFLAALVFRGRSEHRSLVLSLLSIAGVWYVFFRGPDVPAWVYPSYVSFVLGFVILCKRFAPCVGWKYWIAFAPPVVWLVVYKLASWNTIGVPVFVGISYMAFRLSYLAYEINSDENAGAGIWDYLAHAVFLPTFLLGPISPFRNYQQSLNEPLEWEQVWSGLHRVFFGLLKVIVVASVIGQFTTMQFIENAYSYGLLKLSVAIFANLFYLYFNFSGFTDLAIGSGQIVGLRVAENFNRPFSQTNFRDFWNHWHMTLTNYVRDVIYTPMLMWLVRNMQSFPLGLSAAIAASISFFVIGLWHGDGVQYIVLGGMYALGVVYVASGPDLLSLVGVTAQTRHGRAARALAGQVATITYMALCVTVMFLPEDKVNELVGKFWQIF